MFGLLKKRQIVKPPKTDIHSHLIPGVDDGVQSFEESLEIISSFADLGYTKLITTPHIMSDFYDNKEADLIKIHKDLKAKVNEAKIDITIELAAEYYLDDRLSERIEQKDEQFLTFGDNYLLFETSFINEPFQLKEFLFKAISRGLKPVMAHPERYQYLLNDESQLDDLVNRGVIFQVNLNSLHGYYSKHVKRFASKLISRGHVSFLGSDCHNKTHFENLKNAFATKSFDRAMKLPLLNDKL